jgi:hypothetical protein
LSRHTPTPYPTPKEESLSTTVENPKGRNRILEALDAAEKARFASENKSTVYVLFLT